MPPKWFFIVLFNFYLLFIDRNVTSQQSSDRVSRAIFEVATDVIKLHENIDDDSFEMDDSNSPDDERTRRIKRNERDERGLLDLSIEKVPFRHGYVPKTGAGNREEMRINGIIEERIFTDEDFKLRSWKYQRFNSSDFVMLHSQHVIRIWKKTFTDDQDRFQFNPKNSMCTAGSETEGEILMALFYIQNDHFVETLHFAYIVRSPRGQYELRDYDIACSDFRAYKLDYRTPLGLRFVETNDLRSFIILYHDLHEFAQIKCINCLRRSETKVVEASVAYAKDLEVFVINENAFVAVAHRNGFDLFILDEKIERSRWVDGRNIANIVDLISFRIGFQNFLGIATQDGPQRLLLWNDEKFVDHQIFHINKVMQWDAIHMETCREDVILVFYVFGHKAPIQLHIWSGINQKFELAVTDIRVNISHQFDVHPFTQASVLYNTVACILQVDNNGLPHAICLKTHLQPVVDPVFISQNYITNILNHIGRRFKEQDRFVADINNLLSHAVRIGSEIRVPQRFSKIEVSTRAILHEVEYKKVIWMNSQLTLKDLSYGISDLQKRLQHLRGLVFGIKKEMQNDVVYVNKPARIEGLVKFTGPVGIRSLNALSAHVETVNKEPLSPFLNNIYQIGSKARINGHKTFLKEVRVRGSLHTKGINGMNLHRDAVLSNRANNISGLLHIRHGVIANNIRIDGTLNGLRIPEDLIFLRGRRYQISAPKTFDHLMTEIGSLHANIIDGVDIRNISGKILLSHGIQHITSPLVSGREVNMRNVVIKEKFNNLNFDRLMNDLVRIDQPTIITGRKHILNNLMIRQDMIVEQKINGLRIPLDLVTTSEPQRITAPKVFRGSVTFNAPVTVDRFVDGLKLPESVIPLNGTLNRVNSKLFFMRGITAMRDINVRGLVDGVDISNFERQALRRDSEILKGSTIFKGPVVVTRNMDVRGYTNGVDLRRIYADAIFRDRTAPIFVRGRKIFTGRVTVPRLDSEFIAGHHLSSFVQLRQKPTINSNIVFEAPVNFKDVVLTRGRIGGINIQPLMKRRLSLSKTGIIHDGQHFENIRVDSLIVEGTVNGIKPEKEIVLKNIDQVIHAPKVFMNDVAIDSGLNLNNALNVRGSINGIDVSYLIKHRISLSGFQNIPLHLFVANSTFLNVVLRGHRSFNGVNLNQFVGSILYKNGNQVIDAPKIFKQLIIAGNVTTSKGVNGVSMHYLRDKVMRVNGNQVIAANSFADDLHINGNLRVNGGMVNDMNLKLFAFDAVHKHSPNEFRGVNTFVNGFEVRGDIQTHSLNGFNPSTDLLTLTGNQRIRNVSFNDLTVNGDVLFNGRMNGVDLVAFDRGIMKTNRPNNLRGNIVFTGQLLVDQKLFVAGHFNKANVTSAVIHGFRRFGDQRIPSTLILKSNAKFLSTIRAERINNINIREFLDDLVYVNSRHPQLITAHKTFAGGFTIEKQLNQRDGETVILGLLNNFNLHEFSNSVVRIDRPAVISGQLTFRDNVHVYSENGVQLLERINGIDINKDLVFLHRNPGNVTQQIRVLHFDHLIAHNDIFVRGLINGIDLQKESRDTLLKHGDQFITGKKFALNSIYLEKGALVKRLNDFHDLREIVTLNGNRVIRGHWHFVDPVLSIHGNLFVKGLLGSADLQKLAHESLFKNMSQSISRPITFENVVFHKNVRVVGLVNGVNLTDFSINVNEFKRKANETEQKLNQLRHKNFDLSTKIVELIERPNFGIDYFDFFQELNVRGNAFEWHEDSLFKVTDLSKARSHAIHFNKSLHRFEEKGVDSGQITKIFKFQHAKYMIYKLSPQNSSASILRQGDNVFGSLGNYVDDISYVNNGVKKEMLIASLVIGEVNVFILQKVGERIIFQKLTTIDVGPAANKVKVFFIENNYFIAVTRNFQNMCPTANTGSVIYVWEERTHFKVVQRLPIQHSNNVIYYTINNQHYLAFSDISPMSDTKEAPGILVYRYKPDELCCPFRLFQKLKFDGLKGLTAFTFGPSNGKELYLSAVNSSTLIVWRQDGHSGFNQNWSIRVVDGQFVEPVFVENCLFLIVGQRKSCAGLFVFKAILKGGSVEPLRLTSSFNRIT